MPRERERERERERGEGEREMERERENYGCMCLRTASHAATTDQLGATSIQTIHTKGNNSMPLPQQKPKDKKKKRKKVETRYPLIRPHSAPRV